MKDKCGYSKLPTIRVILSVLIGISIIVLPLAYDWAMAVFANEIIGCKLLLFFLLVGFILLIENVLRGDFFFRKFEISIIDVVALCCLIYYIFNIAIIDKWQVDNYVLYGWGAAVVGYLLLRYGRLSLDVLLYACFISGAMQSILAICQWQGFMVSNNVLFDITGSFSNPGQLGGHIAICCIISLTLMQQVFKIKGQRGTLFFFVVAILLQFYGIFLADSRAAWIALFFGGGSLLYSHFFMFLNCHRRNKVIFTIFLCLLIIVGGIVVYKYRPASADARLLIWRVSVDMVVDAPLLGHGASSFSREYMLYQASYFKNNPQSPFIMVADNTIYPFNEFIGVVVRYGILGLLLVSLLFYLALGSSCRKERNKVFKNGLLVLLVFSFFSYPTQIFPLLIFYVFLLGGLDSRIIYSFSFRSFLIVVILIVILEIQIIRDVIVVERMADDLSTLYQRGDDVKEDDYKRMKKNIGFNDYYMTWLSRQNDIEISKNERIKDIQPSCEGYCALSRYYILQNAFHEAKYFLGMASDMIPTRMRPKYELWKLYICEGNEYGAIEIAKEILAMPLKVENSYTLMVKRKMKNYIR